jgi:hypothetical protein
MSGLRERRREKTERAPASRLSDRRVSDRLLEAAEGNLDAICRKVGERVEYLSEGLAAFLESSQQKARTFADTAVLERHRLVAKAMGDSYSSWFPHIPEDNSAPSSFRLPANMPSTTTLRRHSLSLVNVCSERISWTLNKRSCVLPLIFYTLHAYLFIPWALGPQDENGYTPPRYEGIAIVTLMYLMSVFVVSLLFKDYNGPPVQKGVFEWLAVHNLVVVVIHAKLARGLWKEARSAMPSFWGNPATATSSELQKLLYITYMYRMVDYVDTVIMIIRKTYGPSSTFHIVQRVGSAWGWFFIARYGSGGDAYFEALVQCFVSAVVHLYFLVPVGINAFPRLSLFLEPRLLRPRITQIQTLHFAICWVHSFYCLWKRHYPIGLACYQLTYMTYMLVLYTDFQAVHRTWSDDATGSEVDDPTIDAEKLMLSFDSSGWLYVYHFGVAHFMQQNLDDTNAGSLGFSGASGGALVAATLASKASAKELATFIVDEACPAARKKPWMMLEWVKKAMDISKKKYPDGFATLKGRLRILLTRVTWKPPFFLGEVATDFKTEEHVEQTLLASCFVPFLFGAVPRKIDETGGRYLDGFFWPSLFVSWRCSSGDRLLRISVIGAPYADIKPSVPLPFWWAVYPPSQEIMWGIFYLGYMDAAAFFETGHAKARCCRPRGANQEKVVMVNASAWHWLRSLRNLRGADERKLDALPEDADALVSVACHLAIRDWILTILMFGFVMMILATQLTFL